MGVGDGDTVQRADRLANRGLDELAELGLLELGPLGEHGLETVGVGEAADRQGRVGELERAEQAVSAHGRAHARAACGARA